MEITKNLKKIFILAKNVNFILPINNIHSLINFIIKNNIKLSIEEHENLLIIIDENSNYADIHSKILEKYKIAIENYNKLDIKNIKKLIKFYRIPQDLVNKIDEKNFKRKENEKKNKELNKIKSEEWIKEKKYGIERKKYFKSLNDNQLKNLWERKDDMEKDEVLILRDIIREKENIISISPREEKYNICSKCLLLFDSCVCDKSWW